MARGPGHRPLIILRWVLLGLLLAAAAAVLRIYLDRERDREPAKPRVVAGDAGDPVESDDVVLSAEGFEYEVIEEGVTLFFIRSDRMVSDRQDRFVLEGVELRMEEEGGRQYTISSQRAVYDLESKNATLEGSVVMTGPDGIELRGELFDLLNGGRVLESRVGPVAYRLPGAHQGGATGVRINLNRDTLLLRGNVAIDSPPGAEPALQLTAGRMYYSKEERLLRCEGGVLFRRGEDWLSSQRLSVTFSGGGEGLGDIEFVQGHWQVTGRIALDSDPDRSGSLELAAETMGVAFAAGGDQVESVVLEGGGEAAEMRLEDGTGLRQTLTSASIFTTFADGTVSVLETYAPAVLEESLAVPEATPLRRLCGDSLRVRIAPAGGLDELMLAGSVDYRDTRLAATGDQLDGDPESELRLTGGPARLLSGDNDVQAPMIVYSRDDGSLVATGGVRATGVDRSGVELATGDESEPVLVTADEATWTDEPAEVVFRDNVRAWQGESFLLAKRLTALEGGDRLVGKGAVRTVWKPPADEETKRNTIEVNADGFTYLRQLRQINYSGRVRAHEAGRTVRCDELEVLVDAERRIESLVCQGDAVVEDPVNGRTVSGDEAVYTPADRLVLISGTPVTLEQSDGTAMEGRRLRYDMETGQVRIISEPRTAGPEAELAEPVEEPSGPEAAEPVEEPGGPEADEPVEEADG